MIRNDEIVIPIKWLKHLGIFIFEAIIVFSVVIFGVDFFNSMSRPMQTISTADSMAIANSFMVYVTFIFVIVTVAITLAGIYFSRWWGREKKQVLADNWSEMLDTIKKDDKLMSKLKEDLFSESLEGMMKDSLDKHKKQINDETEKKLRKIHQYLSEIIEDPTNKTALNIHHVDDISKILQGDINGKV